ncbi:MAG: DUF881 domain-containing protein, partial [Eubacteriales bacterium]|nr:DUF881 domain-containing protein [Eubacteriales bacterium]
GGLLFICILLGIALALLMKGQNTSSLSEQNMQDLQNNVIEYQRRNEELSNRNAQLQAYIRELESDLTGEGNEVLSRLIDERESYAIFAGLRPAVNSGVVITLRTVPGQKMKDSVLREFVNELSALGAQAISINDERKVATTEIRAKQDSILINAVSFDREQEFEIKAIMRPDDLEQYVLPYLESVSESIVAQLGDEAPSIRIEAQARVEIPALREDRTSYKFDLLKPEQ